MGRADSPTGSEEAREREEGDGWPGADEAILAVGEERMENHDDFGAEGGEGGEGLVSKGFSAGFVPASAWKEAMNLSSSASP